MKESQFTFEEMIRKLKLILKPESSFYIISIIYGVGVSLLTLAIPISVQSLVNTVTFGILTQPLIILSIVLLSLLLFSGVLNALQVYMIELFQRHFYARITTDVTIELLNADYKELGKTDSVELVNRYFDIMTVQKSVTTILTGGVSVILQTLVGLFLLAFYHPYFLIFDIVLIFLLWMVLKLFGRKAIITAITESKSKYKVASWLEEIARENLFFKTRKRKDEALNISDEYICQYLKHRRLHFKQVFFQSIFLLLIYALMSALILGLGGFLVIEGQLSLGQLVAAELVVTVILASFAKSGKYLDAFYDLFAAIDKISKFYILPEEKFEASNNPVFKSHNLNLKDVTLKENKYNFDFNFNFLESKNYYAKSRYFSSKLVFLDLIQSLVQPDKGKIEFGEINYNLISPLDIRDYVYIVSKPTVFEGSILENLTIGHNTVSLPEVHEALEIVDLHHLEDIFDDKLDTRILPSGYPLWSSQLIRLEMARAILHKPKVIVITEIFDQVEEKRRNTILKHLANSKTTIIYFSEKETNIKFDEYLLFERDKIEVFHNYKDLKHRLTELKNEE